MKVRPLEKVMNFAWTVLSLVFKSAKEPRATFVKHHKMLSKDIIQDFAKLGKYLILFLFSLKLSEGIFDLILVIC